MKRFRLALVLVMFAAITVQAASVYVSPDGKDSNKGSKRKPFATLAKALETARADKAKSIILKEGTYYLDKALVLTAEDSGISIEADKEGKAVVSGGVKLELKWEAYKDGIL